MPPGYSLTATASSKTRMARRTITIVVKAIPSSLGKTDIKRKRELVHEPAASFGIVTILIELSGLPETSRVDSKLNLTIVGGNS